MLTDFGGLQELMAVVLWLLGLGSGWLLARTTFRGRSSTVASRVTEAGEMEAQLRQQLEVSERLRVIAAVQVEAQALMDQAVTAAGVRKAEMLEAGKQEVAKIIEDGKAKLAEERLAMLIEARKDLVDIAVKAAAKIVTDGMTEHKSQSLAEEVVRKLT